MGATGTHVAIEAADVTLMNDDLTRVADFIAMSRKVLRRIKLNIFLSIVYNAVGLALGTAGLLTPVAAVIFQEAGCISVVLSSTLLLWARPGR
jgi:cation transport ATPase